MTVLLPEAAGAAEDVVGMGASRKAAQAGGKKAAGRTRAAAPAKSRSQRTQEYVYERTKQAPASYARQAGYVGSRAQLVPGNRNYQGIILGEYLAAVALIALSPIATGGSATAQAKASPSPYATNDLRQLVATSGVYFILALVSSGTHGRFAAWFGGLILLATLISKTGQSQLASLVAVISQQPGGAGTSSGSGSGGATLA